MDAVTPPECAGTQVSSQVAAALLSLIQAFLKTGYYQAGHPETARARAGLYEEVTALFHEQAEITFIANASAEHAEILISGVTDDLLVMGQVMMKSMAEMFLPKFAEYFRRTQLSTFSLKRGISRDEFEQFVDLMTDTPWLLDRQRDIRTRFTEELVARRILHVSTVFREDLVGSGRALPWRVEVSLSRLKRDLNVIPLYRGVPEAKLEEIRRAVFREIIRPLRNADVLRDFLVNLDLITLELHDYQHDELVTNILDCMAEKLMPPVCGQLVATIETLRKAFAEQQDVDLLVRVEQIREVCRQVAARMVAAGQGDAELFTRMVVQKILGSEEVPASLRAEVDGLQAMRQFLQNPRGTLEEIARNPSPEERRPRIARLFALLPELLRHGHCEEALTLWTFAGDEAEEYWRGEGEALLDQARRAAADVVHVEPQAQIEALLRTLPKLGSFGCELLGELLDCDQRVVRRQVLGQLIALGPATEPVLLKTFRRKQGWYFLRNLLIVLSRAGCAGEEVERFFRRCLVHPEANVRKEAVTGTAIIMKERGEPYLLPLGGDVDAEVRSRVIAALAVTGMRTPGSLELLATVLGPKGKEELLAEQALQSINTVKPNHRQAGQLEEPLLGLLRTSRFGFLKRPEGNPKLKLGALHALGWVGSPAAQGVLQSYFEHTSPELARAAREAAARIAERRG